MNITLNQAIAEQNLSAAIEENAKNTFEKSQKTKEKPQKKFLWFNTF